MVQNKTVAIVGGDLRQAHLANTLTEKNNDCKVYGMFLDKDVKLSSRIHKSNDVKHVLPQCDIVIFPLPLLGAKGLVNTQQSADTLTMEECLDHIRPGTAVLAGMVPADVHNLAQSREIEVIDYFQREEFAVMNAVPTAEGAVEIAIRELPITLFGSKCLILGSGRISKALARLLVAFGADVTVAARKHSELAWARISGCKAIHMSELGEHLRDVDCLFNTIPAVILGEEKLSRLGRSCLVIDLASKPGGVDFDTARNLGLKTIWALSLPGKSAPYSAAEIILSTIINILGERGICDG